MVDFVGTPPFWRILLRVVMATKHLGIQGIPGNKMAPMKNCPGECKAGQIRPSGILLF